MIYYSEQVYRPNKDYHNGWIHVFYTVSGSDQQINFSLYIFQWKLFTFVKQPNFYVKYEFKNIKKTVKKIQLAVKTQSTVTLTQNKNR